MYTASTLLRLTLVIKIAIIPRALKITIGRIVSLFPNPPTLVYQLNQASALTQHLLYAATAHAILPTSYDALFSPTIG